MAETLAVAPCFSSVSSYSSRSSFSLLFSPKVPILRCGYFSSRPSTVSARAGSSSGGGDFLGDDNPFSFFPWSDADNAIEWVQEDRVTLFTADGLIQIGGSMVPRRVTSSNKQQGKSNTPQRSQRFKESDYMDPEQKLCLGALFDIAATNGLDMGRRLCIYGFCRSIEMLSDVVEDTVLEHGGEVLAAEKAIKGGLHEKLKMTVAVPLLWGVPPASDTLHLAVRTGGVLYVKYVYKSQPL